MATLDVGQYSSKCVACGRGADPYEKAHITGVGYGFQPPGCGEIFTHITTGYLDAVETVKVMRPDLEFIQ